MKVVNIDTESENVAAAIFGLLAAIEKKRYATMDEAQAFSAAQDIIGMNKECGNRDAAIDGLYKKLGECYYKKIQMRKK